MTRAKPEFSGELDFCSNFFPRSMIMHGVYFRTREHAFQWHKFIHNPLIQGQILSRPTPLEAKWEAKRHQSFRRPDWLSESIPTMENVVETFFSQWRDMNQRLLDTGNKHLEEKNYWHDTFWGTCNGVGENWLGRILMTVRFRLGGVEYHDDNDAGYLARTQK